MNSCPDLQKKSLICPKCKSARWIKNLKRRNNLLPNLSPVDATIQICIKLYK